jgi:hypothetical protein
MSPEIGTLAQSIVAARRKRFPERDAAVAAGFGPGEKGAEAIFSIAIFSRWVGFFLQGASLWKCRCAFGGHIQ